MNGLNCVLLICMGLSLGVDTICLGCNMGGVNCFNVGDSSQCLKNWISQHATYIIAWLKIVGSYMVNRRSFTSPRNPNWNWNHFYKENKLVFIFIQFIYKWKFIHFANIKHAITKYKMFVNGVGKCLLCFFPTNVPHMLLRRHIFIIFHQIWRTKLL